MSPVTAAEIDAAATATLAAASARSARALRIARDTRALLDEIDAIIRPTDPTFAEMLAGSLERSVTELRAALAGDNPTGDELAGLRRFLVDIERPTLPRSWDLVGLDIERAPHLADRTCGVWPRACGDRWYLADGGVSRHYTCTRIASHTGRHAAGLTGAIVAVWEPTTPEALAATGAAA